MRISSRGRSLPWGSARGKNKMRISSRGREDIVNSLRGYRRDPVTISSLFCIHILTFPVAHRMAQIFAGSHHW